MRGKLTQEQKDYIVSHRNEMTDRDMAELLGVPVNRIRTFRQRHHINKSQEFLNYAERHHSGLFEKGHKPFNKGKKVEEYATPETIAKMRASQFKMGSTPPQKNDMLTIVKRKDGYYIKVYDRKVGNYEQLQRYVWEQANGEIPAGMHVCFKDGNRFNVELDNLELMSKREIIIKNSFWKYPKELQELMRELKQAENMLNEIKNK